MYICMCVCIYIYIYTHTCVYLLPRAGAAAAGSQTRAAGQAPVFGRDLPETAETFWQSDRELLGRISELTPYYRRLSRGTIARPSRGLAESNSAALVHPHMRWGARSPRAEKCKKTPTTF